MMNSLDVVSRTLAACLALASLAGCASIEVVHEAPYCPGEQQRQAVELGDDQALASVWRSIQTGPQALSVPSVDFQQRRVVFLADQERPTGGYGLSLASPRFTVNMGEATVLVNATRPAGMAPQVISRPCLLLSLPRGAYDVIRVHEASGGPLWAELRPVQ